MTTFDDRKKSAENKFVHDAEIGFKINTLTNRMIGLWAAGKMQMDAENATNYAKNLVANNVVNTSGKTIAEQLAADFTAHGLDISIEDINNLLEEMEALAKEEVMTQ